MAYVISDACVSCGTCADGCPVGAPLGNKQVVGRGDERIARFVVSVAGSTPA